MWYNKVFSFTFSIYNDTERALPMKKRFTSLSDVEFAALVRKVVRQEKAVEPKESTLQFLKDLARNYRTSERMPEGLQDYVLS